MLQVGDKAVDFDLPTSDGKKIKLSDRLKTASPQIIVFYKFNCPTCQLTFKYLPQIVQDVGVKHFIPVAQDTADETKQFQTTYHYGFEVACDMKPYPVSAAYGIETVPTFFVIEKDMTISKVFEGFDKKGIEEIANRIGELNGKSGYQSFKPTDQVPLLKPG